jgi:hypothetical protein
MMSTEKSQKIALSFLAKPPAEYPAKKRRCDFWNIN